jgi:hypothetical protein
LSKWEKDDGIDATDKRDIDDYYLIKGRVIFKGGKARQKLGKLRLKSQWTNLLMAIYNAGYLPSQIYSIKRSIIEQQMANLAQDKRGSMTVAKYKAISEMVWENPDLDGSHLDKPNLATTQPKKTQLKKSKNITESGQTKIENN